MLGHHGPLVRITIELTTSNSSAAIHGNAYTPVVSQAVAKRQLSAYVSKDMLGVVVLQQLETTGLDSS